MKRVHVLNSSSPFLFLRINFSASQLLLCSWFYLYSASSTSTESQVENMQAKRTCRSISNNGVKFYIIVHQKRLDLRSIGVAWIAIFWWERLLIFCNRLFIVDISTIFHRIWKGTQKWSCKKVTQSTKYFVERDFPPSNPFNFRIQSSGG